MMTVRNDNSSTFGKNSEIKFSLGGKLSIFLLERGCLTSIASGETTFQVFYKLVAAVEGSVRKKLCLANTPVGFNLLMTEGEGMIERIIQRCCLHWKLLMLKVLDSRIC